MGIFAEFFVSLRQIMTEYEKVYCFGVICATCYIRHRAAE